jgi:N-alpha-acetyltransferase 50
MKTLILNSSCRHSVLAPYRSLSLGSALLSNALNIASTTSTPSSPATKTAQATAGRKKATKALLHVQEGNDDAKRFYVEKFGFEVVRL